MNLKKNMKGFTLIELLIVIAILGALAAVILVALNPLQQLGKTRDATRLNTVTSLGHSVEAFATGNNAKYLTVDGTATNCGGAGRNWITCLTSVSGGTGDLTAVPAAVPYSLSYGGLATANCTAATVSDTQMVQNGFCYKQNAAAGGGPAIIYARAEAASNNAKCAPGAGGAATAAWFVYSTVDGRAGVVCSPAGLSTEPSVILAGQTFVN